MPSAAEVRSLSTRGGAPACAGVEPRLARYGRWLALAAALASPLIPCRAAADGATSLNGYWIWDESPGRRTSGGRPDDDASFERLRFPAGGKVVGFSFLAHVFEHGGEALEIGYGRYRAAPHVLTVWSPPTNGIDGWPDRDGV